MSKNIKTYYKEEYESICARLNEFTEWGYDTQLEPLVDALRQSKELIEKAYNSVKDADEKLRDIANYLYERPHYVDDIVKFITDRADENSFQHYSNLLSWTDEKTGVKYYETTFRFELCGKKAEVKIYYNPNTMRSCDYKYDFVK